VLAGTDGSLLAALARTAGAARSVRDARVASGAGRAAVR
jgi:hypothetical protein